MRLAFASFLAATLFSAAPPVAAAEPPNPMATPAPTPGPKINTDLKVARRILLRTPKPAACLGAPSTAVLLSSCSGTPGTRLTLTFGNTITPVAVLFNQSAPSKASYTAQVGRSGGAYTLTVPQLCNGGNPSFSLAFAFERGNTHFSQGLGTFTAICAQTALAPPTSTPLLK